VLDWEKVHLQV